MTLVFPVLISSGSVTKDWLLSKASYWLTCVWMSKHRVVSRPLMRTAVNIGVVKAPSQVFTLKNGISPRPDSCITQAADSVFAADVDSLCKDALCVALREPWLTSSARWGRHAQSGSGPTAF